MKDLRMWLVLPVCTLSFVFPSSAKAIIVTGESIEWVLATSDCVVVGTVIQIDRIRGPNQSKYELVTIAISKNIKGRKVPKVSFLSQVKTLGAPPKEYRFGQQWMDEGVPILFCLVKNEGIRSPSTSKIKWVLRDAIFLGESKYKWNSGCIQVLTREFSVLTEKDSILKYADQTVKATPKEYVPVAHTVNVPADTAVYRRLWSRSSVRLILPVDAKLEKLGQGWCKSIEPIERMQGAGILAHFKNKKNIGLLKSLLGDPFNGIEILYKSTSANPRVLEYRTKIYYVRRAAFDALKKMGLKVERPLVEELVEIRSYRQK